ncbi:hypothetical protein [Aquimarina sp. AU119]|uniref:hypothetical protein n=1 Tax=Aquimarina sp. AU119 TaxID=2108528 RepID=UPI000D698FBC|nr:hypothetical protein [Aquimarina sp. AU119]
MDLNRLTLNKSRGTDDRSTKDNSLDSDENIQRKIIEHGIRLKSGARAHIFSTSEFLFNPNTKLYYRDGLLKLKSNPKPDDPFRWKILNALINKDIKINNIKIHSRIPFSDFISGKEEKRKVPLSNFGGNGRTFPTYTISKKNYPNNTNHFGCSSKKNISEIYYNRKSKGTLAHEFFGHMYLAQKGATYLHQDSLRSKSIIDPFGNPFIGTVIQFIDKCIKPNTKLRVLSPTYHVNKHFLFKSLNWILNIKKINEILSGRKLSKEFENNWITLSLNYSMLFNVPLTEHLRTQYIVRINGKSLNADSVRNQIVKWIGSINKNEFKRNILPLLRKNSMPLMLITHVRFKFHWN